MCVVASQTCLRVYHTQILWVLKKIRWVLKKKKQEKWRFIGAVGRAKGRFSQGFEQFYPFSSRKTSKKLGSPTLDYIN